MIISKDFEEFVESLNRNEVRFLIVGAHALAFHALPRATGDLDVFIARSLENARRVLAALDDFGFGSMNLSEADLTGEDTIIQLGRPPFRIDIITDISGVDFEGAFSRSNHGQFGRHSARYISFEDLMTNKQASGRPKDLIDIDVMMRHKRAQGKDSGE